MAQLSCAGAPDAKTRARLLHPVTHGLLCDGSLGSTTDRRLASPIKGKSLRMDLQAFVHWISSDALFKATPAGSTCQEVDHKMLRLVTATAPTTGKGLQEDFTIHIFLTSFPQKDLPGSQGGDVEKGV